MSLLMLLLACSPTETWVIEPYMSPCEGAFAMSCMLASVDDGPVEFVYEGIDGFTFALGDRVTATVRSEDVLNPPLDGAGVRHTLVEEISRESAVGETFDVAFNPGSGMITVDESAGSGTMVGQPWTCEASLCGEIAAAIGGTSAFEVTFLFVDGADGVAIEAQAVGAG